MEPEKVNINIYQVEQLLKSEHGNIGDFSQAQLNAMIQLLACYSNSNNPTTNTDLQMFAAAINNVMSQLFPGGTCPPNASIATQTLFADLTIPGSGESQSLAQAAASADPVTALGNMGNDISELYTDCLQPGGTNDWFVNGKHQSGVPPYTPDSDTNLQQDLNAYLQQIADIESVLFPSGGAPLSPTNNPPLFYAELGNLASLLTTIHSEVSADSGNGYSNSIAALFNHSLTLPGSSSPTTLATLITAFTSATPGSAAQAQAATALEQALYGSPPAAGNGQGLSDTLFEYISGASDNAWGSGPG